MLRADGIKRVHISPASPWQNGIAERWIGNCRRELLDHLIILNNVHLRRLIQDYISYYHADRIHDSLEKDTPAMRPVSSKPDQGFSQRAEAISQRPLVSMVSAIL
jgi:transposase InsO family protein